MISALTEYMYRLANIPRNESVVFWTATPCRTRDQYLHGPSQSYGIALNAFIFPTREGFENEVVRVLIMNIIPRAANISTTAKNDDNSKNTGMRLAFLSGHQGSALNEGSRADQGNDEGTAISASTPSPAPGRHARHPGGECPICLTTDVETPVQTNCGHWYCAR